MRRLICTEPLTGFKRPRSDLSACFCRNRSLRHADIFSLLYLNIQMLQHRLVVISQRGIPTGYQPVSFSILTHAHTSLSNADFPFQYFQSENSFHFKSENSFHFTHFHSFVKRIQRGKNRRAVIKYNSPVLSYYSTVLIKQAALHDFHYIATDTFAADRDSRKHNTASTTLWHNSIIY